MYQLRVCHFISIYFEVVVVSERSRADTGDMNPFPHKYVKFVIKFVGKSYKYFKF